MLRRLKSDVEIDVPPKREVLVYAPLTSVQEGFYKAAVNKTLEALVKDKKKKDLVGVYWQLYIVFLDRYYTAKIAQLRDGLPSLLTHGSNTLQQ